MKSKAFLIIFIFILLCFSFIGIKSNTDNVVLKFSSWGSQSELEVLKSVITDFENEHKNIKIDFIHIPQNYFQKIHLLFASGLEPDVLFMNNQNIQLYIKANLLTDLSEYFENTEQTFFNEALDCFKDGNKLYAIPRDISNLVIYYNKDILKKTGVKLSQKIQTIDELKTITEELTTDTNWGINFEENPLFWLYYLASNGGGVLSDDKKSVIINSKESLYALNLYSDMINKYHIMPTKAQIGSMTSAQMFINGKLAMYLGGRWMVPKFRETLNFDWDIIEFPSSPEHKVYVDASGWAIAKNSKHKEEAVEFIKYLSSAETISKFTKSGLIVPARIDIAQSPIFLENNKKPLNNIAFINMLNQAKPTPVNKQYSSVNDILIEKSQNLFYGDKRAEDIFDDKTVKEIENLL